jgi:hypothetical protein
VNRDHFRPEYPGLTARAATIITREELSRSPLFQGVETAADNQADVVARDEFVQPSDGLVRCLLDLFDRSRHVVPSCVGVAAPGRGRRRRGTFVLPLLAGVLTTVAVTRRRRKRLGLVPDPVDDWAWLDEPRVALL